MATLETLISVETKLKMLEFAIEDVEQIVQDKIVPTMERRVKTKQQTKVQEVRVEKTFRTLENGAKR